VFKVISVYLGLVIRVLPSETLSQTQNFVAFSDFFLAMARQSSQVLSA